MGIFHDREGVNELFWPEVNSDREHFALPDDMIALPETLPEETAVD